MGVLRNFSSKVRKELSYSKFSITKETEPVDKGDELPLRVIACPLAHFDAIGFAARPVEDSAVAYALESGAYQLDSRHVADRIYVIFPCANCQNFCCC
jgi:hypothetical protein